jgi:hypothetical protein
MRVRAAAADRTSLALGAVFALASAFYIWTALTSFPLVFHEGGLDRYNELATAFLHFRLAVGSAPRSLLALAEPYNPAQNASIVADGLHDEILYGGRLYLLWGPAPALVLLVPLHLLGLEPSSSATTPFFAVIGLGFALGTLRLLLRALGGVALWMSVLAGLAVALCSVMPFLLRTPSETADTIAGGFCFAMAGIWLATGAFADRRASLSRLALASLCFGLAAGSRPTLALTAAILIPLYLSLRSNRPHRRLLAALAVPFGVCLLLLLGYNQARFGNPLEFGSRHQLAGYDAQTEPLSGVSYVPPGVWYYLLSPPRPLVLFPFVALTPPPPLTYPAGAPSHYEVPEMTGGLLPMMPIVLLLPVLPWIWRRRPEWLGPLGAPLVALAGAGAAIVLLISYEIFSTTERYEVDFSMPLLLGSLAAWLALSQRLSGRRRRLVRVGGGLLVAWGCLMGIAISFVGYGNFLAVEHPGTWAELQDLGSPLSSVIARLAGGPVLAEVSTPNVLHSAPVHYTSLGSADDRFWLEADNRANLTVASPDARKAVLTLDVVPAVETLETQSIQPGRETVGMTLHGSWQASAAYLIPPAGRRLRIGLQLHAGVNHLELSPVASTLALPNPRTPALSSVLLVSGLSLEDAP